VPAHVRGQGAYAGLLALLVNEPQVSPGGHRGHGSCTLRLPVGAAQPLQCATAAALVFAYAGPTCSDVSGHLLAGRAWAEDASLPRRDDVMVGPVRRDRGSSFGLPAKVG